MHVVAAGPLPQIRIQHTWLGGLCHWQHMEQQSACVAHGLWPTPCRGDSATLRCRSRVHNAQVAGAHSGQEDGAETVCSQPQQGIVFCICGHSGLILPVGRLPSCVPTWTCLYIVHLAISLLHSRPEPVISESGICAGAWASAGRVHLGPGYHLEQSIGAHLQHGGAGCAEGLVDALLSYGSELRSVQNHQRTAAETSGRWLALPGNCHC